MASGGEDDANLAAAGHKFKAAHALRELNELRGAAELARQAARDDNRSVAHHKEDPVS